MAPQSPVPPGDDPELTARVLAALTDAALTNLSVEFVEGTLVLRGMAGSAELREAATDRARAVAGGAPVENRMRVG